MGWSRNNILKLRNAANDGFINLFTLAGGVDVDAASNFNEDVTFTGATSGRNVVFDIIISIIFGWRWTPRLKEIKENIPFFLYHFQ